MCPKAHTPDRITQYADMPFTRQRGLLLASVLLLVACLARCGEPSRPLQIVTLTDAQASAQADSIRATVSVELADGLELSLWASETLMADPIALVFDERGRAWITRTVRQKNSEFDIRGHMDWATASTTWRTVEDRRAFLRQTFAPERSEENAWLADLNGDSLHDWRDLAVEKERVYVIEDVSGDGIADRAQLYTEDFHEEITDIAGGLLPLGDDVYVGVAPDVWRLRDTSGDGMADRKTSISHGYGVHVGFSGHNISGLIMGPDGRLYWSIGDIGYDVTGPDGTRWANPNQGAIFRSELDGSGFEVFAWGLRNTHEFMFDKYGNLISVDNDGDHPGETERVVYIVNGSDSGWRSNWQYGKYTDPDNNAYKVWMDEGLFRPRWDGQAAYILPPVASYHAGPAGMAYNPGTALGDAWKDHFFVAEFVGASARSHIYAFRLAPRGAGFDLDGEEVVARGILATGIDFGPDGALYAADWIAGWDTNDLGRVWKIDDPVSAASAIRRETRELIVEDLTGRTRDDLVSLLAHADMRVRSKAQFALADRGDRESLASVATEGSDQLARIHGIWGLGQLARRDDVAAGPLVGLLADGDPEIRAQAARILGDVRYAAAAEALRPLLGDPAPRVRFFAAEALGRLAYRPALEPLLGMLEANDGEDAWLQHGGIIALARIGDPEPLVALADHASRSLRVAAVVALRRMGDPGVARFLQDQDEYVITEAARAINDDASIEAALPALAALVSDRPQGNEALMRRALNAQLRLQTPDGARAVAAFASRTDVSELLRAEAIAILGVWPEPSILDRVDGVHRGPIRGDAEAARSAMEPITSALLTSGSESIQLAAVDAVARLGVESAVPTLLRLLEGAPSSTVRVAALEALSRPGFGDMGEMAVRTALEDGDLQVRLAGLERITALSLPEERVAEYLETVLEKGTVREQQAALLTLGSVGSEPSRQILSRVFDRLASGSLDPSLQVDAMDAIAAGGGPDLQARFATYEQGITSNPVPQSRAELLASYGATLQGGDPRQGRGIVFRNAEAQCVRCHAFGDMGGGVGPDLVGVASRLDAVQILESLVAPSAVISPGFGSVVLTLADGTTVSGIVKTETAGIVTVETAPGSIVEVAEGDIAARQSGPSGMPPMGLLLDRRQLRDVVAFLSTLKDD